MSTSVGRTAAWRLASLSGSLVVTAALAAPVARAQDSEKGATPNLARPVVEAAKRKMGVERLIERNAYFEARRQKPGDPNFDRAAARLAAIAMKDAQPLAEIPGGGPGTVWVPIGPAPSTNGQTPQDFAQPSPVSGRLTDIVLDPVNGAIFAGAAQGGLWKSVNNGATWTPLTDTLGSLATGAIAMDPTNNNVLYYGTGEGNFSGDSYAGVGIFKSTDNGTTWSGPFGNAFFQSRSVPSIVVHRTTPSIVLAASSSGIFGVGVVTGPGATARGIFKSTDGGVTWVKKPNPAGMAADVRGSILFQDPLVATRWYAAMANIDAVSGGIWLSTDTGETWTSLNGAPGAPPMAVPAVGINRYWITGGANVGDPLSTLYLGTGHNNVSAARGGRIYKSTDSGATWAQQAAANDYCMGQCFYDMPVWTVPNNRDIVYHGGAGAVDTGGTTVANIRKSTNGGTTFVDIMRCPGACPANGGVPTAIHSDTHAIVTDAANPNVLWVGSDGGLWRSTDAGTTWQNRNTNIQTMQFTAFDVLASSNNNLSYGGTQDNGTMGWRGTGIDGVAWPHLDFGDGGYAQIDQGSATANNLVHTYFNQTGNLIGVGCTTGGFAVTQGGYNGSFAPGNGIAISDRVAFYAPIHLDRGTGAATQTLYFGTNRIWRAPSFFGAPCTAGGAAFTSLSGVTDLLGGAGFFTAIETFRNPSPGVNADIVWAGSNTGRVFRTLNANAGAPTWNEMDLGNTRFISDILVDPANSNVIYVARSGFAGAAGQNVRKSTDGGGTWAFAATGIPDIPVNAIALDPTTPNRVWAGTDIGVYVSINGGTSWAPFGTGLPNAAVFDVKASANPPGGGGNGAILLVTHGRGSFKLAPLTPVELQDFKIE